MYIGYRFSIDSWSDLVDRKTIGIVDLWVSDDTALVLALSTIFECI